jgi:hypothetical protein
MSGFQVKIYRNVTVRVTSPRWINRTRYVHMTTFTESLV